MMIGKEEVQLPSENFYVCNRWANIHVDLLERVLLLLPPRDVVKACSTCIAWNSVLSASSMRLLRLPWLLLEPFFENDATYPFITFLCPNENLTFDICLPFDGVDGFNIRQSGIPGWLFLPVYGSRSMLLNPLNRVCIPLPDFPKRVLLERSTIFAMSETNIKANCFPCCLKILCICNDTVLLHVIKPGDNQGWKILSFNSHKAQDIIYHQEKFFILLEHGGLLVCDLKNHPNSLILKKFRSYFWKEYVRKEHESNAKLMKCYLAQNSAGDIYYLLWLPLAEDDFKASLGAFKCEIDHQQIMSCSNDDDDDYDDDLSSTRIEYSEASHDKVNWVLDNRILEEDQIFFVDHRRIIFISRRIGSGFHDARENQFYHVDRFRASSSLSPLEIKLRYTYRMILRWEKWVIEHDKLSWFMPASYSSIDRSRQTS